MMVPVNPVTRRLVLAGIFATVAGAATAQTPDAAESARAFVAAIYRNFESDAAMRRFNWSSSSQLQRLFERQLAQAITKDIDSGENSIGFVPFVNSQDPEPRKTTVTVQQVDANRAIVVARAEGIADPSTVQYVLTRGAQGWRIRNMTWPGQNPPMDSLRQLLNLPE